MAAARNRRDDGAALVELALILPVLALLVVGTLDLARAYRLDIRLENAAREGAAFAQVVPNDVACTGGANDVEDRVRLEDPDLLNEDGFGIVVSYESAPGVFTPYSGCDSGTVDPGERVRVRTEATYDILTPLMGTFFGSTIDMHAEAEVVTQG